MKRRSSKPLQPRQAETIGCVWYLPSGDEAVRVLTEMDEIKHTVPPGDVQRPSIFTKVEDETFFVCWAWVLRSTPPISSVVPGSSINSAAQLFQRTIRKA